MKGKININYCIFIFVLIFEFVYCDESLYKHWSNANCDGSPDVITNLGNEIKTSEGIVNTDIKNCQGTVNVNGGVYTYQWYLNECSKDSKNGSWIITSNQTQCVIPGITTFKYESTRTSSSSQPSNIKQENKGKKNNINDFVKTFIIMSFIHFYYF
jgi:hypothetical protein